jgi:N-formylglutamate deformylase
MILHIPHSSNRIPSDVRSQFVLADDELAVELLLMTDAYTYELFAFRDATVVTCPISRLVVDVERFSDDRCEPMSNVGMGVIYTKTAFGRTLRSPLLPAERVDLLHRYYEPHHEMLGRETRKELEAADQAVIVDCHSFPNQPLPCDQDQTKPRPDFCIGTDPFHTPGSLVDIAASTIKALGFEVQINSPYSGAIVPDKFFGKDRRVAAIMIEVNRSTYMDETTGKRRNSFEAVRNVIQEVLGALGGSSV